jgi:hypothetical protein
MAFRSSGIAPNSRTGASVLCGGTATQWLDAPTSTAATLGNTSSSRLRIAIAEMLHNSAANPSSFGWVHAMLTTQALASSVICGARGRW